MQFDVVVVGGGHAGTEAAAAAARMGAKTLLVTQSIESIGAMSCNPSIGGIGKGHLVREIDALDGVMPLAAEFSAIHKKRLNTSKGEAVQATRMQIDRAAYRSATRALLERQNNLRIFQAHCLDLIVAEKQIGDGGTKKAIGVTCAGGIEIFAHSVVLTTGTFLRGQIHIGLHSHAAGRAGDAPAIALSESLSNAGLEPIRLKTGTPPRLDGRTIQFSLCVEQGSDARSPFLPAPYFSYQYLLVDSLPQISCWMTRTNSATRDAVLAGLGESPLYSGVILSRGPRYCPSIEDKYFRYPHNPDHHIFLEPEGIETFEFYPNGISTSLSLETQERLVRSIPPLRKAELLRPGYAIEYDFFDPRGLTADLSCKAIQGLFLAGQINGTTGYEEAAAQGLVAGANAALSAKSTKPWQPSRENSYIGVMIEDLTNNGVSEPYRMFTSRAESRLFLREDNADVRLTEKGRELGLVGKDRWEAFQRKAEFVSRETTRLKSFLDEAGDRGEGRVQSGVQPSRKTLHEEQEKEWERIVRIEKKYEGYIKANKTRT